MQDSETDTTGATTKNDSESQSANMQRQAQFSLA